MFSGQLSAEQIARRERLHRLLQELNIDSVWAHDAVKLHGIAIVNRCVAEFAVDDNDIRLPTLGEHRIQTTSSIPIKQDLDQFHMPDGSKWRMSYIIYLT